MVMSVSAVISACQVAGSAEHHRLGALVMLAGAALHQVRGQRERRTREPDQRHLAQRVDQQRHRIEHRRHLLRIQRFDGRDVVGRADRVGDHGSDVGNDVQVDAGAAQRHDDVGEQDGGVHLVPADGLQGDFADQLGVEAGVEHPVPAAQRAVLGQAAAGLAHEPHRHPGRLAAARGGQIGDSGSSRCVFGGAFIDVHAAMQAIRAQRPANPENGAPATAAAPIGLASIVVTSGEPAEFHDAVDAMNAATVRPEIELGPIRPPQRLAPFSYAIGAEVKHPEAAVVPEQSDGDAFGRLILLHDPDGSDAWDGTMRLVAYIQADLDSSEAIDPLLPEVAWSWLVEALDARPDHVTALGGTVTATTSVRYGDISGPPRAHQLELRASWTATTLDLGVHVQAFCEVLEHAAGLPPVGVTDLGSRSRA